MKFVAAVVMFVCAFAGVHSSLLAQIAPAVSYVNSVAPSWAGSWGGPWGGSWGGSWGGPWAAPAAVSIQAAPWGPASGLHAGIPGISLAQGPAAAAIATPLAPKLLGHEGVYVAKTRGALHTAPLAGHVNSATSLNLAPAPGTL